MKHRPTKSGKSFSDPKAAVWILRIQGVLNRYKGFIDILRYIFRYNQDFGASFVIYVRNVPQFGSLNIRISKLDTFPFEFKLSLYV